MDAADPLSTQREGHFELTAELNAAGFENADEIGRGGFGVVYRCEQRVLERVVAVKVLAEGLEDENLERFLREQRAMGKLSGHPNIVNIFQVGATASGRPYIVMQYHSHGSLDARVNRDGPITWQEAVHIGVRLAGALETAHQRNMLHRDVKPGNVLLTEYGEPQLTDFGIARIAGGFETAAGAITGSPAFTAPEVLQGQPPDPSADLYSLASTLFSVVTGHAVFERLSGEQMVSQFLRITRQPMPDLADSGLPPISPWRSNERCHAIADLDRPPPASSARCCRTCSVATACRSTNSRSRSRRRHPSAETGAPRRPPPERRGAPTPRAQSRRPRRPPGSDRRRRRGPWWSGTG